MKRHPALVALSTDHHHGLVQARRLVKAAEAGSGGDLEPVAGAFLDFWSEDTSKHFREEEEVLLPAFARYGDPSDPSVARMLVEHVRIRQLVADLKSQMQLDPPAPSPHTMQTIGEMLRAHIRLEEDTVFPLIEQAMPEEALNELSGQLAAYAAGQ